MGPRARGAAGLTLSVLIAILCDMIPNPEAAELNERIRQLVASGGAGSEEYQRLLAEWLRATVVPAA